MHQNVRVWPNTVEPPNNGHVGDEHFVHCLEVLPSSEVDNIYAGDEQFVHCREVVHSSECSTQMRMRARADINGRVRARGLVRTQYRVSCR